MRPTLLLLLFLPARATVLLDTLILGGNDVTASLIPDTIFPLLVDLTNATSVIPSSPDVDAILGKSARWYFPNGTFYSFALVYVTRVRFTLSTPDDGAAVANLRCCLNRPINDHRAIALDHVAIEEVKSPVLQFFTTPWPSYVGFIFASVWLLTVCGGACILCCSHHHHKTATQTTAQMRISVPKGGFVFRSAAPPPPSDPRGKWTHLRVPGTRR